MTIEERARELFTLEKQSDLSYVVMFKGEFYDEFPEKDGAEVWVEGATRKFAEFADSIAAPYKEALEKIAERNGCEWNCADVARAALHPAEPQNAAEYETPK